jgi:hypothetical protein
MTLRDGKIVRATLYLDRDEAMEAARVSEEAGGMFGARGEPG